MHTPTFTREILSLGKTDNERAAALGVSRFTLIEWKNGRLPSQIKRLLERPQLIAALAADAQAAQKITAEA